MENELKRMEKAEALLIKYARELLAWEYPRRGLNQLIEVAIEEHRENHYESGEPRHRPSCLGSFEARESALLNLTIRRLRAVGWTEEDYAAIVSRIFDPASIVAERAT
jgi:hypothetical protein